LIVNRKIIFSFDIGEKDLNPEERTGAGLRVKLKRLVHWERKRMADKIRHPLFELIEAN
jgi:hypothetical protein